MVQKHLKTARIDDYIILTVERDKPETVKELVQIIQEKFRSSEEEITEHILSLQSRGKLTFKAPPAPTPTTSMAYILSREACWYWTIIILSVTTSILVFTVPEDLFPAAYARYLLGSIFVLFLPGYSFIKALFPSRELDNIERTALSIGMSLALVPIAGLLLNYTPWGIRVTPVTLSLLALTVAFSTAAVIRERQVKLQE